MNNNKNEIGSDFHCCNGLCVYLEAKLMHRSIRALDLLCMGGGEGVVFTDSATRSKAREIFEIEENGENGTKKGLRERLGERKDKESKKHTPSTIFML